MTIKAKLISVICIVFALILIVSGVVYFRAGGILTELLDSSALELTVMSAQTVKDKLDTVASMTESIGAAFKFGVEESWLSEEELERLAMGILVECGKNGITDTFFGNELTGRLSTSSGWKEPPGYDVRARPWYKAAIAAGKRTAAFSAPYLSAATGKTVLTASVPIYYRDGKLMGVAASDMDLSYVNKFVLGCRIMGAGAGTLVQGDGLILVHTNDSYRLKANILNDSMFDDSTKAIARRMLSGETGVATYRHRSAGDGAEEALRVYFAPVGYGYYIYTFCPVSVMQSRVTDLTYMVLFFSVIALSLAGAIACSMIRRIGSCTDDIDSVAERLMNGDLSARFNESGSDEFSHIYASLNSAIAAAQSGVAEQNFAAVADEVRKMANETGVSSSKDVCRLVDTLMRHSQDSIKAAAETERLLAEVVQKAVRVQIALGSSLSANVKLNDALQIINTASNASAELYQADGGPAKSSEGDASEN